MHLRYDLLLNPLVIICSLLSVIIPLAVQYVNRYLHTHGDPPWKQSNEKKERNND